LTIFTKLQEVFLISRLHYFNDAIMKDILRYGLLLTLFPSIVFAQKVISIKVDGTINPATADFITVELRKPQRKRHRAFLFI